MILKDIVLWRKMTYNYWHRTNNKLMYIKMLWYMDAQLVFNMKWYSGQINQKFEFLFEKKPIISIKRFGVFLKKNYPNKVNLTMNVQSVNEL